MDWDEVSYVIRSEYRRDIIETLSEQKMTPSNLASELEMHQSHVSNTLTDLLEHNLVQRLVDAPKGRIYGLTDEGQEIAEKIEQENL